MRRLLAVVAGTGAAALLLGLAAPTAPAVAAPVPTKNPVALGTGGAVASVDPDASRVGIEVLRSGGNAVDAAVAAAATLGVTEPYSAGIGGGGFFVVYEAATGKVSTIDGRETAPGAMRRDVFLDPATGEPIPFGEAVNSGLSVGVPGTLRTWSRALELFGTRSLGSSLRPAAEVAREGFVVDETFATATADNAERFSLFAPTRKLFLPGGRPPAVGSVFRNPDLARTYEEIGREGQSTFYRGDIARDIVDTVRRPPVVPGTTAVVRPGLMRLPDLARYSAPLRAPTSVGYRGVQVYGMAPPSSGGTTVGEALNILERFDLGSMSRAQAYHHYLESTRLAFADRNRYVGDPRYVDVPVRELLSDGFARERACLIDPRRALTSPVAPGSPDGSYVGCAPARTGRTAADSEGKSTTHLTVADSAGNVVAYTLTIEQTGGSGIVVPGRGFLLNNELTDFNFAPLFEGVFDPNLPAPGKRPRSSMSPTIVLRDGKPLVALGSPGGSTIITTVLQVLVNYLDLGLSLPAAVAAPRASQRNGDPGAAEPEFLAAPYADRLDALGQQLAETAEIGAVAAVELLPGGRLRAVAEPRRRGGGDARVVDPGR